MNLAEAVSSIESLKLGEVICARPPWVPEAEAVICEYDIEDGSIPEHIEKAGFKVFLDRVDGMDVLSMFKTQGRTPSLEEKVRLLAYFAEFDAYPDWVYEK